MFKLSGYQITEELHSGVSTVIYRAIKKREQKSVILKVFKSEYPTLEEITRLRQEYNITQNIECKGIVKAYSLEKCQNAFALVLEDFGGQSLKQVLSSRKVYLKEFLQIVIALAETLTYLHNNSIIHKDIKASNIIINTETEIVKLTDFSIASRLSSENPTISNPNELEGTIAYISPEQTGRMNRSIDYRTDFYSLGVTFYEMLTGNLPFITTDPMELIHSHLAKQPVPPHHLNPEIPEAISSIVMKLLAKTSENRYQSALGLKFDLETCLLQLQKSGKIENFPLGRQDRGSQLLISQKLYGREAEVAMLMDAFERVSGSSEFSVLSSELEDSTQNSKLKTQNSRSEMMLVSGYSGVGKTSVVSEIHKPIVAARGYFITGKFDQFKRNIPYAALIQAFQELIRSLLTESSENLAIWKEKLLSQLGNNGQVIVDVIPEVELIIGKQPPVPLLGATESQNRFNRVFQQFIDVFCQPEHPLVIFLDDLQWADLASLKLIQLLTCDCDRQYLLTIGAYRDNEVSPTHPLIQTIEKIQETGAVVNNITLKPLNISHIKQLVVDTLNESPDLRNRISGLVELVFNKTQGNPFFLTQLLKTLYSENLLVYDANAGCWQWDIEKIQAIGITDCNVVELIARNIQKLPSTTQNVLKLAACIGNQFNLDVLAIVNGKSQTATATDFWDALQAGLILPLSNAYKIPLTGDWERQARRLSYATGDKGEGGERGGRSISLSLSLDPLPSSQSPITYKFLHDRVQQAAYSLIPESEKKATHLKIGQLLLKNTTPESQKENIFALVNQLNFGIDLISTQSEKDELASLNLIAGQKAKAATAYEAAVNYLNLGLGLLAADSWQRNYNLTLNIYIEAVEAAYLNTNFELGQELSDVALKQAKTLLEKVKVYELKIQFYIAQNQMQVAIELGQQVLEMLGVRLEQEPPSDLIIEDCCNLPSMTDPYKLAAIRILIAVISAAYIADPALLLLVVFTMASLCIKCGNPPLAAYVYGFYGVLLCGPLGDIDSGYRFGQLSLRLLEQFDARELKAKVLNEFNGYVRHWKEHTCKTIEPLLEAFQSGLEIGDLEFAGYAALNCCTNIFFIGDHLESVAQKYVHYIDLLQKLNLEYHVCYGQIGRQLVLNLQNLTKDKLKLIGSAFDESQMLPILIETKNGPSLFYAYLAKTILLYLFKESEPAIVNAREAEKYAQTVTGLITVAEHNFYYSLALLAQYPNAEEREQSEYLNQVASNQEKMKLWAYHAPCNFQHKYDLVEAEKARVLGQIGEAISLYDQAIIGAGEQGYIQEEALANELVAEFHLARGAKKIAQFHITEAYYAYIRWGATAKVKDLEERYPQFLTRITAQKPVSIDINRTTTTTTGGNSRVLDLATVMKASQAISSEIVLPQLLNKLMKIAIENAGAQKGFLILVQQGKLVISASGTVDDEVVTVWQSPDIQTEQAVPIAVLNYVQRTQKNVVLNEATKEGLFNIDPYIIKNKPLSILCTPIINQGKLIGLFYLENNLIAGSFTCQRVEVLKLLASQAAISIENARLVADLSSTSEQLKQANEQLEDYSRTLEVKVQERTQELQTSEAQLRERTNQLEKALCELQQTQTQLIQTEKMSSLGQLVAGVAHEINNPINFIKGNLCYAREYCQQLLHLIALYQHNYPNPTEEIKAETEDVELSFLKEDLPKLLESMQVGAERIRQIVLCLQNFSRLNESSMKPVDIHQGVESTLMLLQPRLRKEGRRSGIEVIKKYGQLPLVNCYAADLNQVFMNILSNAIDALEVTRGTQEESNQLPTITICTEVSEKEYVTIRIADNGFGMPQSVKEKIFDPFFTTKPVGSGTGLGLSISYQIVVEKHGGRLSCVTAPGQGSEFAIAIPICSGRTGQNASGSNQIIRNS